MNSAAPAARLSAQGEFRGRIYDNILETIGATPLIRFSRLASVHGIEADILGKCEQSKAKRDAYFERFCDEWLAEAGKLGFSLGELIESLQTRVVNGRLNDEADDAHQ